MIDKRASQIRRMFHSIAPRYDFLNHLLSLEQDRLWRRRVTRLGLADGQRPRRLLDLCTGTGDLALQFARRRDGPRLVVGVDFAEGMLRRARAKITRARLNNRPVLLCADALQLPFADQAFDLVTVAFGVRNFEDLSRGLIEIARVTRPGGRVIILEFSRAQTPVFRTLYGLYFTHLLPRIGRCISKTTSYHYLRDSVMQFPERERFQAELEARGFEDVEMFPLTFGVAMIYLGTRR